MKKTIIVVLVFISTALLGCNDQTTPASTIRTSHHFLMKNKQKKFYATLTENAAIKYGNPVGMEQLRLELIKYPSFTTGTEQLTSKQVLINTPRRKKIRTNYTLDLLAGNEVVRQADVLCLYDGHIQRVRHCFRSHCRFHREWVENTECRISDLR